MSIWKSVLIATSLATSVPGLAQPPSSPVPLVELAQRRAKADALLAVTKYDQVAQAMMPKLLDIIFQQLIKGNKDQDVEIRKIVTEELSSRFERLTPKIHEKARDLYADRFTADELQKMVDFFGSSLGEKMIALTPQIQLEMFSFGQQAGQAAALDAMPHIIERMRSANLNLPAKS